MSEAQISITPFLGTWALDPEQSESQIGTPPQKGTYQLIPEGEQIAVAYVQWKNLLSIESDYCPYGKLCL